jgi:RimJ/RimL family protein N-acetyltransferase
MPFEVLNLKDSANSDWLTSIARDHPFPPLWWVPGLSDGSRRSLLEANLRSLLDAPDSAFIGYREADKLLGVAALRHMPWDSNHFGFCVYRVEQFDVWGDVAQLELRAARLAEAVVARARELGARTVHASLPMEAIAAIHALDSAGFRIMDVLVTWIFEHGKQQISDYPDKCIIRGVQPGDAEVLVPLARTAYTDTPDRFHADPHLPTERSNELYAEWIKNSFNGKLADYIVVAEVDGKPAGYTTLKLEGDHQGKSNVKTGGLILSAVAPWAEGRGVYTSMINGGLRWFQQQGVQVSHLGTQVNNYPVERAWARLGFRLAKAGPSLHLWLGD